MVLIWVFGSQDLLVKVVLMDVQVLKVCLEILASMESRDLKEHQVRGLVRITVVV